jgi:hypothetical protein
MIDLKIIIEVQTTTGYRGRRFLVDTGAELSAAPRRLATEVGHDWNRLPSLAVTGVGPGRLPVRLGTLSIRLGEIELSVRCLFLDQPDGPLVLGCVDVLDRFALTIDAGVGKIIFTEIP